MDADTTYRVVIQTNGNCHVFCGRSLVAKVEKWAIRGKDSRAAVIRDLRFQAICLENAADMIEGSFGMAPAEIIDCRVVADHAADPTHPVRA